MGPVPRYRWDTGGTCTSVQVGYRWDLYLGTGGIQVGLVPRYRWDNNGSLLCTIGLKIRRVINYQCRDIITFEQPDPGLSGAVLNNDKNSVECCVSPVTHCHNYSRT